MADQRAFGNTDRFPAEVGTQVRDIAQDAGAQVRDRAQDAGAGRVPETCGYCLEASPVPSALCPPASRQASNQIFSLSLSPPCLV